MDKDIEIIPNKDKIQFQRRLSSALEKLPKCYAAIVTSKYKDLKKQDLYNVVKGRSRNYMVLEAMESVAKMLSKK